jgi:hypothetical protein
MMLFCIGIALIFGWRLMRDVTGPIRNMVIKVELQRHIAEHIVRHFSIAFRRLIGQIAF